MRGQSKKSGVWRRSDATTGGPIVTFGTKCPSITSTWSQSAAGTTSPTCSANSPKSADSTDGAMRRSPGRPGSRRTVVVPSSMGSRRSAEAGPAEDAPEPVEVRLALAELFDQPLPVPIHEGVEEFGRQPSAIGREEGAHHPFDDLARRLELVT